MIALNDIHIRTELIPGDIGYITHLHGKLYQEEYGYKTQFEIYVAQGLIEFYKHYNSQTNRVWMCEYQNKMVGSMVLMNRGKAAQLRYFLLQPEVRGIGLGRKLMDLFFEFLHQCHYESCYLLTTDELPVAAHLYRSKGFKLTDETPSEAFGKRVKEQKYELIISPD